ncbi:MAG: 4-hydroxy-tetrahydrodipicolinate reductase [Candidatus Omnitrophota bacterium]|jgi:4-hydroxy-tetrahydrodipicolinate reductase
MIKLGLAGAAGRMGTAIIELALDEPKIFSVDSGYEAKAFDGLGNPRAYSSRSLKHSKQVGLKTANEASFKNVDVCIDFTVHQATMEHITLALKTNTAMVIGTTGFDTNELAMIKKAAKKIAIMLSPNMSVGANLVFALAEKASGILGSSYDIEVIEAHHRHKKDAPSGTANRLAEGIANARGWDLAKVAKYGRQGFSGERPTEEIGMHVVRAGEIIGEHEAMFAGPGETIRISHQAGTRDAFAGGALVAAKFISKKKSGLYNMNDVLGL